MELVKELEENTYLCPKCGEAYTIEEFFYRLNNGAIEIYWQGCKSCYRAYRKELRARAKSKMPISEEKVIMLTKNLESIRSRDLGWKEEKLELNRALRRMFPNIKELGSGIARTGFAIGDYIIKIALSGTEHNKYEVEAYNKIKKYYPKLEKYFMPILDYDKENYTWILVPKAKTVNGKDLDREKACEVSSKLKEAFAKYNISVPDLHDENIGVYKNQPVVIDVGFGLRRNI